MFVTDTITSDDILITLGSAEQCKKLRHCIGTLNFKFCIEEETVNFNQSIN